MNASSLLGLAALAALAMPQAQGYPDWLTDLGKGFRESRATGKPVFVVFR